MCQQTFFLVWYLQTSVTDKFYRSLSFSGTTSQAQYLRLMGNCSTLTRVRFEYNAISGYVPDGVWGLPLVEILSMQNNQLEGVIPSSIGGAIHLGELQIQNNKFSGPLPRCIGNLTALHRLDVSGNRFGGRIPEELGDLHQINELALGGNMLHGGAGPDSVASFAGLLAERFPVQVLTLVHPGFGGTPRPAGVELGAQAW